jgi:hypothetical protein
VPAAVRCSSDHQHPKREEPALAAMAGAGKPVRGAVHVVLRVRRHEASEDADVVRLGRESAAGGVRRHLDGVARAARHESQSGRRRASTLRISYHGRQCRGWRSSPEGYAGHIDDGGREERPLTAPNRKSQSALFGQNCATQPVRLTNEDGPRPTKKDGPLTKRNPSFPPADKGFSFAARDCDVGMIVVSRTSRVRSPSSRIFMRVPPSGKNAMRAVRRRDS